MPNYTTMLTPADCAVALIDFQPAMYQGVQSHDRIRLCLKTCHFADNPR
jgi:hypothetical protein